MNYAQALDYIHSRNLFGKKAGLDGITRLMALMGNPQNNLKFVHVAGTNGKGSTTTMIASVLQAAGYKTGKYISPFILNFRERIQVNGELISEDALADCTTYVKTFCDRMEAEGQAPTEFEVVTAVALEWYRRCGCDYAVLEVGLGGRFDPTNVISVPLVSVITSISFDHEAILGDTLTAIAGEKAGIIKPGGITVCYPDQPEEALAELMKQAAEQDNRFVVGGKNAAEIGKKDLFGTEMTYAGLALTIPLLGEHQVYNAITAIEAVNVLRYDRGIPISDEAIIEGIGATRFPARFEILSRDPVIILDGAHNPDGIEMLGRSLDILGGRGIIAIFGASQGKKVADALAFVLPHCRDVICTAASYDKKALPVDELMEQIRPIAPQARVAPNRESAYQMALEMVGPDDVILIFGSLYLASDMREIVLGRQTL